MPEQMRSYGTARGIFSFLEFVGWSVVVIGIIVGLIMAESAGRYVSDGQKFMLFLMGASSSLVGLFMVGAVQNWRAGVDSAEYGQQMLKISRDQLEATGGRSRLVCSFAIDRGPNAQSVVRSGQADCSSPAHPKRRNRTCNLSWRADQMVQWGISSAWRLVCHLRGGPESRRRKVGRSGHRRQTGIVRIYNIRDRAIVRCGKTSGA